MNINFSQKVEKNDEFYNKEGNSNYFFQSIETPIELDATSFIGSFEKINFFIGSNNSGKSRFLRGLLKIDKHFIQILKGNKNFDTIFNEIQASFDIFKSNDLQSVQIEKLRNLLTEISKKNETIISNKGDLFYVNLLSNYKINLSFFEGLESLKQDLIETNQIVNHNGYLKHYQDALDYIEKMIELFEMLKFSFENNIKKTLYIPILRSIIYDLNFNAATFNEAFNKKYGIKDNIYRGEDLYDNIYRITNSINRKKIEEFEKFLSSNFFNGKSTQLIADKADTQSILLNIENELVPIYDIGDGIQQLILLMFPIFTAKENTWFFIEEPETHLHPGLQRIFIETLLNDKYLETKKSRYFFTTHSNHFLDLSLRTKETSIFQFHKEGKEKFIIKNVKPNKETLDLLGVNNSSVLIANSSIWVEGPTDRKYISRFLKLFFHHNEIQNLKEDIDFAFFEYGGNLIAHYLFDPIFEENVAEEDVRKSINAFASANKIYLLADNDNAKENEKQKRREKLQALSDKEKNFKYQNTNYREIENLLPVKVIKDFLDELVNSSEKENINKIHFDREDYISDGLGKFITELFEKNKITDFKKFKDDSGTLKSSYKTKLCEFVINGDYSYQELIKDNEQLDSIISDLYEFINQK